MAANTSHERNLLFAGLGLQLSLLTKEHLVRAFSEWILNKNLSLGEILVQQKAITPEQLKTIEGAIDLQIQNDGGEVQALASVKNPNEIEVCLKAVEDPELKMTLCTMNALQSRKIVGNEVDQERMANSQGLIQPHPGKKPPEQRFQRKHFLDGGNLGEIWFAKDEELNRTVVLKYIKAEQQGSPFSKALFTLEGEVTGYLEHPAVVPVYSMGQDNKDRSFYAMRYIRGRKLTRAIADYQALPASSIGKRREALTELLQAFQTACLAIEYAHSKGILHCDLKPDNIVVGPFGETLVIDWGLAMVTNPPAEMAQGMQTLDHIPNATASGEVAGPYSPSESAHLGLHSSQGGMRKFVGGTPAYMAPEQMRATRGGEVEGVIHSSDIFGLGAILYHLLTGQAPYFPDKEKREGNEEFFKRIEKGDCPRPRQLHPEIPKPLEAILLKAMAASPADRYASARELAEEVKRWLADEPVHAYRENTWERGRRWGRNHRTTVVAGIMLLFCLACGGLGMALLTQGYNQELQSYYQKLQISEKEARKQESLAKESEQKALIQEGFAIEQKELAEKRAKMAISAVKQFSETVVADFDLQNRTELGPLRKALLKEPIRFYKEFSAQLRSEKNPSRQSVQELAGALYRLGQLTFKDDSPEDALLSLKEALTIEETLVQTNPTNSEFQKSLATSHEILSNFYNNSNRKKEAEESLQKALVIIESLAKTNPTNSEFQRDLANRYERLGDFYDNSNRQKEAESSYNKALATIESVAKSNPTNSEFQRDLAYQYDRLGDFYDNSNRQKEAEASYNKALAIIEAVAKSNPTDLELHKGWAIRYDRLADLYDNSNRQREGEVSRQKALAVKEYLVKSNPTDSELQFELAEYQEYLGKLVLIPNRINEAETSYQKALVIRESLVKAYPTDPRFLEHLADSHFSLAILYGCTNRPKEAEASLQKILEIQELYKKSTLGPPFGGTPEGFLRSVGGLVNLGGGGWWTQNHSIQPTSIQ